MNRPPKYKPVRKPKHSAAEKEYFKSIADQIRAKREQATQDKTETV